MWEKDLQKHDTLETLPSVPGTQNTPQTLIQRVVSKVLASIRTGHNTSRRAALIDGTAHVTLALTPSQNIDTLQTWENTIPENFEELRKIAEKSYKLFAKNSAFPHIVSFKGLELLKIELNHYTLACILWNKDDVDVSNDEVLVSAVDWENLPISTMTKSEISAFIPYMPTIYLKRIIGSNREINPYTLKDTVHVHEWMCIADFVKNYYYSDKAFFYNSYANLLIVQHYPSDAFFHDIIDFVTHYRLSLFDDSRNSTEFSSMYKVFIEIIFHESSTISPEIREKAKMCLINEIQKQYFGEWKVRNADNPNPHTDTSYCMPFTKIKSYVATRKVKSKIHFPELMAHFDGFVTQHQLWSHLQEGPDSSVIWFLESIR